MRRVFIELLSFLFVVITAWLEIKRFLISPLQFRHRRLAVRFVALEFVKPSARFVDSHFAELTLGCTRSESDIDRS